MVNENTINVFLYSVGTCRRQTVLERWIWNVLLNILKISAEKFKIALWILIYQMILNEFRLLSLTDVAVVKNLVQRWEIIPICDIQCNREIVTLSCHYCTLLMSFNGIFHVVSIYATFVAFVLQNYRCKEMKWPPRQNTSPDISS